MRTLASTRSGNVQVVQAMLPIRALIILGIAVAAIIRHHEGHADRVSKVIEFHMVTRSTCGVAFDVEARFKGRQTELAIPRSSAEDLAILLKEPRLPVGMIVD